MKKLLAVTLSFFMAFEFVGNVDVNAACVTKKEEVKEIKQEVNYVVNEAEEKPEVKWVNVLFPQPEPGKTPKDVYFKAETDPIGAINEEALKTIDISQYWQVSEDGENYTYMKADDTFVLGKYYKMDPMDMIDVAMTLFADMNDYVNTDVVSGLSKDFKIAINDVEIDMNGNMFKILSDVSATLDYGVCVAKVNKIELQFTEPADGAKTVTDSTIVGEDKDKIDLFKANEADDFVTWIDEATGKKMAKDETYVAGKRYTAEVTLQLKEYCVFSANVIALVNENIAEIKLSEDGKLCTVKYTCVVETPDIVKDAERDDASVSKEAAKFSDKTFNYVITKAAAGKKAGEVKITGLVKKNIKKANIKATVKYDNAKYIVTEIEKKAFKGAKKLKTVKIGKNVKVVGAKAFYNLKKLTKVTIKGNSIKKIGKKAFFKKGKKLTIKVNKKAKKNIKKLIKKAKCKGVKVK